MSMRFNPALSIFFTAGFLVAGGHALSCYSGESSNLTPEQNCVMCQATIKSNDDVPITTFQCVKDRKAAQQGCMRTQTLEEDEEVEGLMFSRCTCCSELCNTIEFGKICPDEAAAATATTATPTLSTEAPVHQVIEESSSATEKAVVVTAPAAENPPGKGISCYVGQETLTSNGKVGTSIVLQPGCTKCQTVSERDGGDVKINYLCTTTDEQCVTDQSIIDEKLACTCCESSCNLPEKVADSCVLQRIDSTTTTQEPDAIHTAAIVMVAAPEAKEETGFSCFFGEEVTKDGDKIATPIVARGGCAKCLTISELDGDEVKTFYKCVKTNELEGVCSASQQITDTKRECACCGDRCNLPENVADTCVVKAPEKPTTPEPQLQTEPIVIVPDPERNLDAGLSCYIGQSVKKNVGDSSATPITIANGCSSCQMTSTLDASGTKTFYICAKADGDAEKCSSSDQTEKAKDSVSRDCVCCEDKCNSPDAMNKTCSVKADELIVTTTAVLKTTIPPVSVASSPKKHTCNVGHEYWNYLFDEGRDLVNVTLELTPKYDCIMCQVLRINQNRGTGRLTQFTCVTENDVYPSASFVCSESKRLLYQTMSLRRHSVIWTAATRCSCCGDQCNSRSYADDDCLDMSNFAPAVMLNSVTLRSHASPKTSSLSLAVLLLPAPLLASRALFRLD